MDPQADWRDVFCGRDAELKLLISAYDTIASGGGPRLAVITAERGMGKTRLVQELYRHLTTKCDPDDYWPDANLFKGNNLRVAPDFNDAHTKGHFAAFKTTERPMPFLWWGFRLNDPLDRNAVRSDMAGHRRTLDPHLERALFARGHAARLNDVKGATLGTAKGAAIAIGELVLEGVPGLGALKSAVELAIGLHTAVKQRGVAKGHEERFAEANLAGIDEARTQDIYEGTLDDLALVLESGDKLRKVPVVVFCDDAQFARDGGDEGALRFLDKLWQRAEEGQWPLLLVATHWEVDWEQDRQSENVSLAKTFCSVAGDANKSTIIRLSQQSALGALIAGGLPELPPRDVDLLLGKSDGNPQVLIELVGLIQASRAWRAHGALTPHARKKIETLSCNLTTLITNRLMSDATPDEVRVAVALSSLQGMQFLSTLTEAAGQALNLGATSSGLNTAANPLRLIVGLDAGVASFVQRAYREAAESLVESQLGDPEEIKAGVLHAAIAIIDGPERWAMLDADKQRAMLGVMVSLAEDSLDDAMRVRAGHALVQLVELATENAQRASHARQFAAGLSSKWPADAFTLSQLSCVRSALGEWYGFGATAELCERIVEVARSRKADPVDGEKHLQAALLAASSAYRDLGDHRKAYGLCEEWVEPIRRRAQSDPSPENIDTLCDALRELWWIACALSVDDCAGGDEVVLREIVAIRRDQYRTQVPSISGMDALISALDDLSRRVPSTEAVEICREIVELRRKIAARSDKQDGRVQSDLASALERLAEVLHKAGHLRESAEARLENLALLRDHWNLFPTDEDFAEQLAQALNTAAEQMSDDLPGQRGLLLEAAELLEAVERLVETNRDRSYEQRHTPQYYLRNDLRYILRCELQSALARNAASSGEWDLAREHCLQAAQFGSWDKIRRENVRVLSQEIQSQLPSGVNWPSTEDLKAADVAGLKMADPVLDALRRQFHTAPDVQVLCGLARVLSDRVAKLVDAGLLDDAEKAARECYEVECWGSREEWLQGPRYDFMYTARCFQSILGAFRAEKLFDKALEFANELVKLLRTDAPSGKDEGLDVADALKAASEIAEAADQRQLALQLADESLVITRRVVQNDRQSNLLESLLKPLDWRAQLARGDKDWVTYDAVQLECLKIRKDLSEGDGLSFLGILVAQVNLLESACNRLDTNAVAKWAASMVDTVRETRDRAANYVGYARLIETLAAAVACVKNIDPPAIRGLKAELAETARDLLTKGFKNAEKFEVLAVRLRELELDEEARLFEREAHAIRERELGADTPT